MENTKMSSKETQVMYPGGREPSKLDVPLSGRRYGARPDYVDMKYAAIQIGQYRGKLGTPMRLRKVPRLVERDEASSGSRGIVYRVTFRGRGKNGIMEEHDYAGKFMHPSKFNKPSGGLDAQDISDHKKRLYREGEYAQTIRDIILREDNTRYDYSNMGFKLIDCLIQVHDYGEIGIPEDVRGRIPGEEVGFVIMDYIKGANLDAMVTFGGPIDQGLVLRALLPVTNILEILHQKLQLIHRDVTPGNIMLTREGIPKLSDFGLVKRIEGFNEGRRIRGAGTPAFCSEESLDPTQDIDDKSDIFSIGSTGYYLLTGNQIRYGDSYEEMMRTPIDRNKIYRSMVSSKVNLGLIDILVECMSDNPGRRPDATKVKDGLDSLIPLIEPNIGFPELIKLLIERKISENR